MSDPRNVLEALFLQAYPVALRSAQVRSAGMVSRYREFEREDLEQEILIQIWLALRQFDAARASLSTFVERVAATTIASICRRNSAVKRTKPADYHPPESAQLLVKVELFVDLQRALAKLAPRDRKVALLSAECSPAEIARSLKVSRTSVYRSLNRIRRALIKSELGC